MDETMIPSLAETPVLMLKAREEGRLLAGHLWVFSNELQRVPKHVPPGSLCVVKKASGDTFGVGFFNPNSLIAVRVLARGVEHLSEDFFRERLAHAIRAREQHYPGASAVRLCFGESDGLPGLIVDRFEDVLVAQVLSAGMERHWPEVQEALLSLLKPRGILLKNDHDWRRLEGLPLEVKTAWGEVPEKIQITDGELRYWVSLKEGQKTGFYLDQRDNRNFLKPFWAGRRVLDLYCYSGSFALHAAKGGAKEVWGVDSSGQAIALAEANAEANGLGDLVRFQKQQAEEMLEMMVEKELPVKPDFVLLDPPNLVPSRSALSQATKLYVKLNAMALKGLPSGGYLASSSCAHHVTREHFMEILKEAAAKAGRSVKLIALRGQALDHPVLLAMPETEYLHFALLQVV